MADVLGTLKKTWLKGMEVVGNAASNIASNTKQKVSEMNMENRRREILSDFGLIAYEMWQKGTAFPKELEDQLTELSRLDEELNALRAQRFKGVEQSEADAPQDDDAEASQDPALIAENDSDEDSVSYEEPAQDDAFEQEEQDGEDQ